MRVAHHGKLFNVQRFGNLGKLCVYTAYSVNKERKKNYSACCVPEYCEGAYTVCNVHVMSCQFNSWRMDVDDSKSCIPATLGPLVCV